MVRELENTSKWPGLKQLGWIKIIELASEWLLFKFIEKYLTYQMTACLVYFLSNRENNHSYACTYLIINRLLIKILNNIRSIICRASQTCLSHG